MRPIENETRVTMNTRRNFVNYATMWLSDGTELHLTPSDFRISGNTFTDDWVDGDAFQVGTAIGKTATILLDNTDGRTEEIGSSTVTYPHGKFSQYDFYMAYFQLFVCLPDAYHYNGELRDQMIPIGIFTVTEPVANSATIEITGVDNMYMFDKSFDECTLDFSTPQTLSTILNRCCTDCLGVAYGQSFNNQNLTVDTKPEDATYRQVISYIAQIAGCNAVIDSYGRFKLKWYDTSVFQSNIDGGSFTAIGEEFLFRTQTWQSGSGASGYSIFYDRLPRTGTYKITKVIVKDIVDPSTFDGYLNVYQFSSFLDSANNVPFDTAYGREDRETLKHIQLVEGENIVNQNIDITALNRTNYFAGVGSDSGSGSTFTVEYYLMPLSYDDGDSYDGGTFDPELRRSHLTWSATSGSSGIVWYSTQYNSNYIAPAGNYTITRIYIDEIVDANHLNPVYEIQKSIDSGTTWTTEDSGSLVAGDNVINYTMAIPNTDTIKYRVRVGQDVTEDPDATSFRIQQFFKADNTPYTDGDSVDGGDFTASLGFHNLKNIKSTQVSTDEIHFTGVTIKSDVAEIHYPTSGWEGYVLTIEDNPFVVNNEYDIAQYLYGRLQNIIIRPFSCSAIQDPTIEAGDCALVYNVKGNTYPTIITNVQFTTGGYTDVNCKAEAPLAQNSRYVSSAATAVAQVTTKMNDYNKQVAHFNELASEALGYYQTEEVDSQTGAVITYIHDEPTLENSTIIWKITSTGIFISEDGGDSYNSGYDVSTATMLMNLVYAHGITADWIQTGTLDVGIGKEFNNSPVFRAFTSTVVATLSVTEYSDCTINPQTLGMTANSKCGIYVDTVGAGVFSGSATLYLYNGSSFDTLEEINLNIGDNHFTHMIDITISDSEYYYVRCWINGGTTYRARVYVGVLNTTINSAGITTKKLYATGGKIAGYTINHPVNGNGLFYNENNVYAEYSVNKMHIGAYHNNIWTFCGTSNAGEFLHIDYGNSDNTQNGLWVTANGANDLYNFNTPCMHINAGSVSCSAHGEVQWSGSDRKLKKGIKNLTLKKAKELVFSVVPREFEFKETAGKRYGFIAQELRDVLPEDSGIEFENEGIKNINYNDFIAPLCMLVKNQQEEINALKERIEQLESIVNTNK